MPMPQGFKDRLYPHLDAIAAHYGTPFHIYDEAGIRATGRQVQAAFADIPGFREFYAVKALPNPAILAIMRDLGFGFDCSSETELLLARSLGARGEKIMFTSNNTSPADFAAAAAEGGCLLNLDDITLVDKVPAMPELICFRYNPGTRRTGNDIIGKPEEAKYGVSHEQIVEAYRRAMARGAKRFGLHTMLASNELHYSYMVQTASMLLDLVATIGGELGIRFEFINIGGGLGIPYLPDIDPLNIEAMGEEITALFVDFQDRCGYSPALFMESGRYMTGPHGALVTRAINRKEIYRTYVGVTPACPPSCGPACTAPTTTSRCLPGWRRRPWRPWTWSARCARTTTSSRCSGRCRASTTATWWSFTTPAPTATPWASTTTAACGRRSCCCARTARSP